MKKINTSLLRSLLRFASAYRWIFLCVAIMGIASSLLAVVRPYLFKVTIDDYIVKKDLSGLYWISLAIVILLLLEVMLQMLFSYYSNWLGQTVICDMRQRLFRHLLGFKMRYFNTSSVGILVTRAVNDMERIAEVFSSGFFEIVSDLLKMLVVMGVMLWVDIKMALLVFLMLPVLLCATRWFQQSMKKAFSEVRKQVGLLNSFVQERLSGMKVVQLFTVEAIEYEKFLKINREHEKAWLKTVWHNSIFFPVAELLISVATGLVVWYGGLRSLSDNTADLGNIFMFIQLIQLLFRPLRQIADKFNTLQMGMIAADRVFAIFDTTDISEEHRGIPWKGIEKAVRFDNVHFSYVKGEEVLKGVSFEVKKGETIAIVGATGAGKSTIIHLLNRFYEIDEGVISIDSTDIREIRLDALRSRIAVVLQDVFLFADSILNNITLQNPQISEEEVQKAAKEIGIHEFLLQLPGGYHYNVKERGTMLSSGQRQLISFLRAYVMQPDLLILDEATSSVDAQSERLIQQATERITQNRTSIIIAHRLATVRRADRIIVLDKGRIVEQGTHTELLMRTDGYYRTLYHAQFEHKSKNLKENKR